MVQFTFIVAALAAAGSVVNAAPPPRAHSVYQVKEMHPVPRKWEKRDRAPQGHMIDLQIGVRQSNFDELENRLYEGET